MFFNSMLITAFMAGILRAEKVPALQAIAQLRPQMRGDSASEIRKTLAESIPGVSYPVLHTIPQTSFSCDQVQPGFYADPEAYCQVYRRCEPDSTMFSYLCPNRTLFNQVTLICDWFYNVDCAKSVSFYTYSNPRVFFFNGNFLDDGTTTVQPVPIANNPFNAANTFDNFQFEDSFQADTVIQNEPQFPAAPGLRQLTTIIPKTFQPLQSIDSLRQATNTLPSLNNRMLVPDVNIFPAFSRTIPSTVTFNQQNTTMATDVPTSVVTVPFFNRQTFPTITSEDVTAATVSATTDDENPSEYVDSLELTLNITTKENVSSPASNAWTLPASPFFPKRIFRILRPPRNSSGINQPLFPSLTFA